MAFTVVPRLQGASERGQVIVEIAGTHHLKISKMALMTEEMPKKGRLSDSELGSESTRRPV